jgi:hypothetical protein
MQHEEPVAVVVVPLEEAEAAMGLLRANGIESATRVTEEADENIGTTPLEPVEIIVHPNDAERARELLNAPA